jgi:uncharacterized protein (DUF983 family)
MDGVDMLVLKGVARPCPDCAEERLFVPADADLAGAAEASAGTEYCCTWCGAGLLIDPLLADGKSPSQHVA